MDRVIGNGSGGKVIVTMRRLRGWNGFTELEYGFFPHSPAQLLVESRQALYIGRVDGGPLNRLG